MHLSFRLLCASRPVPAASSPTWVTDLISHNAIKNNAGGWGTVFQGVEDHKIKVLLLFPRLTKQLNFAVWVQQHCKGEFFIFLEFIFSPGVEIFSARDF